MRESHIWTKRVVVSCDMTACECSGHVLGAESGPPWGHAMPHTWAPPKTASDSAWPGFKLIVGRWCSETFDCCRVFLWLPSFSYITRSTALGLSRCASDRPWAFRCLVGPSALVKFISARGLSYPRISWKRWDCLSWWRWGTVIPWESDWIPGVEVWVRKRGSGSQDEKELQNPHVGWL